MVSGTFSSVATARRERLLAIRDQLLKNITEEERTNSVRIGVFDSGVGGLSMVSVLLQKLGVQQRSTVHQLMIGSENPRPSVDVRYCGDTAHFPFGNKSYDELVERVLTLLEYLTGTGCHHIAIACNTASIVFMRLLEETLTESDADVRDVLTDNIVGTVTATARFVADIQIQHNLGNRIGVIATKYTVASGAYVRALGHCCDADPVVIQSAEELLVDAVERADEASIDREVKRIAEHFTAHQVDTFILGCTHYGHVAHKLMAALHDSVHIIDPARVMALRMAKVARYPSDITTQLVFSGNVPEGLEKYLPKAAFSSTAVTI